MKRHILVLAAVAAMVSLAPVQPALSKVEAVEEIPTFHNTPPEGKLPATLPASQFPNSDVIVRNAYTLAARIKPVLYQMPCYCFCERSEKHQSLLDCYRGKHAAECNVCKREALYAYRETAKGKSVEEIRAGIIRGEWKDIDYAQWQKLQPALKSQQKAAGN